MRYRDVRPTIIKHIGLEDPHAFSGATPRRVSAFRNGALRAGIDAKDVLQPYVNRAERRESTKRLRRFRRGVGIPKDQQPWRVKVDG